MTRPNAAVRQCLCSDSHLYVPIPPGQTFKSAFTLHYYSFEPTAATFNAASQKASEKTYAGVLGHMFVPHTYKEFQEVLWVVASANPVWIGFMDEVNEGKWRLSHGPYAGVDVSDALWWWPGENNGGTAENCALYAPNLFELGDAPCSHSHRYVIEFECPFGQQFNSQGTACVGQFQFMLLSSYCLMPTWPIACRLCLLLQLRIRRRRLAQSTPPGWHLMASCH